MFISILCLSLGCGMMIGVLLFIVWFLLSLLLYILNLGRVPFLDIFSPIDADFTTDGSEIILDKAVGKRKYW
ncbi:hypothetical protein [Cognatishimia sp.]|uniref:hypothetical protein n=1 Tax=Cognatishimia sp. TaxID=2211648 RepID=UPI003519189A|nr:hypothetical protein [Cognatishimia sp.]